MTHFFIAHGLPLLFVVVMLESFGIPVPGETALIAFGVLASQGHHSIIAILRFTAAWVAGLGRMPWWKFLFWNAAGGIAWATTVGLVSYYAGKAAADAIQRYGFVAAGGFAALFVLGWLGFRLFARRLEERL